MTVVNKYEWNESYYCVIGWDDGSKQEFKSKSALTDEQWLELATACYLKDKLGKIALSDASEWELKLELERRGKTTEDVDKATDPAVVEEETLPEVK